MKKNFTSNMNHQSASEKEKQKQNRKIRKFKFLYVIVHKDRYDFFQNFIIPKTMNIY